MQSETVAPNDKLVLVAGGTGLLGRSIVRRLSSGGYRVRVLTRDPSRARELESLGVQIVAGDVRNAESGRQACEGVDAVVSSIQALTGTNGNTPQTVDDLGNRHLIDAARSARVDHFVFASAFGAAPDHPVDFFRIKCAIEQYLESSGLTYTVVRAPGFMEFWANLMARPLLTKGKVTINGRGRNPINFISVEDVSYFVVRALEDPRLRNRIVDVGGPENLTLEQMLTTLEEVTGACAKRGYMHLPIMHLARVVLAPFNPSLSRLIHLAILMDTTDQTLNVSEAMREFGAPQMRLAEVARAQFRRSAP
jgi:uncharacterized protein YbjT (DUF2867 family)